MSAKERLVYAALDLAFGKTLHEHTKHLDKPADPEVERAFLAAALDYAEGEKVEYDAKDVP